MAKFRRELRTVAERPFGYLSALIKTGEGLIKSQLHFLSPSLCALSSHCRLSHFSIAAAVPWSSHCRRLPALSYPAPPALHPSHCIIRAEPPQLACLSRESALTTRVLAIRSLPRPEPILPWSWFILVPCPSTRCSFEPCFSV